MYIMGGNKANENDPIFGCEFNCEFSCNPKVCPEDKDLNHLGGIQTIGEWFVVGFEDSKKWKDACSQIRFYKFENDKPRYKKCLTIKRKRSDGTRRHGSKKAHCKAGKAGSVGITNYWDCEGFRYLLAVCPWEGMKYQGRRDGEIHFYRDAAKRSVE